MEFRISVSRGHLELDGDAAQEHRLTGFGVSYPHQLLIDRATASGASALGVTQQLALKLAVLAHHERRPSPMHAKEQTQGAEVAILDPQLIGLDELE